MEEKSKVKLKIFKGVNSKSLSAISSLIHSYSKKKKILFAIMILFSLSIFSMSMPFIPLSYAQPNITKIFFIGLVFTPVIFLCIFSIPSIISQMHSNTLIKRIGSTRLNERGYILTIWIVFFIRALIYFLISLVLWTIAFSLVGKLPTELGNELSQITAGIIISMILNHSFAFITFSLIYIMFLVSFGILLGMIPIGQISKGILSLLIFISIILFGNIFVPLGLLFDEIMPVVSIVFTILNPVTLLSVILEGLYNGSFTIGYSILYYIISISLTISTFLLAASLISFNKVN